MNTQAMTQQQIRIAGIEILEKYLGIIGMIRFMQQNEIGYGDYTKDRDTLLGNPSLEELVNAIQSSSVNKKLSKLI